MPDTSMHANTAFCKIIGVSFVFEKMYINNKCPVKNKGKPNLEISRFNANNKPAVRNNPVPNHLSKFNLDLCIFYSSASLPYS